MGQQSLSKCCNAKVVVRDGKNKCIKCKRALEAGDIHTVNTKMAGNVNLS